MVQMVPGAAIWIPMLLLLQSNVHVLVAVKRCAATLMLSPT